MRILFTIPHYVRPGGEGPGDGRTFGSLAADPGPRLQALTACLTALHQLYHPTECFIHHGERLARLEATSFPHHLDIVICTTGGCHLLNQLPIKPRYYSHQPTTTEPLLLGFACHDVLRDRLGQFDYYCYLEDDLVLHDPWLFRKLAWFNRLAGDESCSSPTASRPD
jgi:hypothetical protein